MSSTITGNKKMVEDTLVRQFAGLSTTLVSDNLDRLRGAVGLSPIHGDRPLCGRAFTVQTRPGDNLFVHLSLDLAEPGDVIVIDGGGHETGALMGEIMMRYAKSRGIAGFVVDGAIRDAGSFKEADFPCFARSISHRGPYKNGPGNVGATVSIGGMTVSPGDIIIGDADGVVAVRPDEADTVLEKATAQLAAEQRLLAEIAAGTFDRSWLKDLIEAHRGR
nr:RraA family protein [Rhizobium sp. CG5]